MNTHDNLNQANELGSTIAKLVAQPYGLTDQTVNVIDSLIAALAAKAHELLNQPAIAKVQASLDDPRPSIPHDQVMAEMEEILVAACADASPHASDCSTNNRGVPELLGPCDCDQALCRGAYVATVDGPIRFESRDLVQYLSAAAKNGQIDHSIRCVSSGNGKAEFYIRPANGDGLTLQFVASTTNVA